MAMHKISGTSKFQVIERTHIIIPPTERVQNVYPFIQSNSYNKEVLVCFESIEKLSIY
ncbi:Hypothetical predicted protein, partial [Olea europaea subsp. europaea]